MLNLNLIIITLLGIATSFFTNISGGAALLYIPALIFFGLPPTIAVATNRFSSLGPTVSLYQFNKNKKVIYKLAIPLAFFATIGSFIGAKLLLRIDENLLQKIVGISIVLLAFLAIMKKDMGTEKKDIPITKKRNVLGYVLSFFLGIYIGFFGAASATFLSYLLILVFGLTFIESAGTRTIIDLPVIIIATIVFILAKQINFAYGWGLLAGRAIGAHFGAGFAIKHGEKYARVIFIILALISGIKLLIP
jgi:hypothetical protein